MGLFSRNKSEEVRDVYISKNVNWFSVRSPQHIKVLLENSYNHYGKIVPSGNLFEETKGVDELVCDMEKNECWSKPEDAKGLHSLNFKINDSAASYLYQSYNRQPPAKAGFSMASGGWNPGFTPDITKIEKTSKHVKIPIKFCKNYGCDEAAWQKYLQAKEKGKAF